MEKGKEGTTRGGFLGAFTIFPFLFSLFILSGCGTPGDPTPPRPPVPAPITDLAARQIGDRVVLTFTLPQKTVEGEPLREPPQIEIYRGFVARGAAPSQAAPGTLVYTIPTAVVDTYLAEGPDASGRGRVRFEDPVKPEDVTKHAGEQWVYAVRTRATKRRNSDASNVVALRVYPVPEPAGELSAVVTANAIELRWAASTRAAGGAVSYRVYRAEVEPGTEAEAAATADPAKAKLLAPPALVAVTPAPTYADPQFEFGRTYFYTVRSVAQFEADSVESADSRPAIVTPRDTFPPAAPLNLIAVVTPATAETPATIELSWGISPEPDLAGYHVYRSEQEGTPGERISRELLPAPAFRDISIVPGRRYTYSVTAVDRAGNESPRSTPVTEAVPERPR